MSRFRVQTKTEKAIVLMVATLVTVSVLAFWYVNQAAGATYTWDGGGADNNWSTCANWTTDTCPGSADIAAFDGSTTTDSVVDASFAGSVAGVDVNAGYTGTITQKRNLTIGASNFDQADGTWKQSTTTFDINNGDFLLSGGTFETGVGTSTVELDFTISGGTYTASSSSVVVFDNSATFKPTTLTCSGTLPGKVDVTKNTTQGTSFTLASGCEVNGLGSFSAGTHVTINGTFNFGSSIHIDGGDFTNNGTSTIDSGGTITLEHNFTQNGVFDLTNVTMTLDGGSFGMDSTISCSGPLGATLDIAKTRADQLVTIGSGCEATTTTAVSTECDITVEGILHLGTSLDPDHGTFTNNGTTTVESGFTGRFEGDFYQNGYLDLTDGTLIFDSADNFDDSIFTCSGTQNGLIDIAKSDSGATFELSSGCSVTGATSTSAGDVTINGTWDTGGRTLTGNSLTIGSNGTLRVHGDESLTSPALNSGSTVDYYGSGTYSSLTASTDYHHLAFTGGGTYNIGSSVTVAGDLTSTNDSTFNQTSGTLTLDGTGQQTVTGTSTFNNLTKSVSATSTVFFGANQEQTVSGTLTLQGDSNSTLYVKSTATGTQWQIDMQGLRTLEYLTISDGNNTNSTTAYCDTGCSDDGNNTNIEFTSDPDGGKVYWDGGGGDNNWSTCANWKFDTCPTPTEAAAFDNRSVKNATTDASFGGEVKGLSIESGYTGTVTSNRSLTVGTDGFTLQDGTFTAPASTLTVNGDFTHSGGTFSHNSGSVVIQSGGQISTLASTVLNDIEIGGAHDTSLQSYWKLDESEAGTSTDSSGNGNTGTGSGSSGTNDKPQPSTDVPDVAFVDPYSLNFDGTDDTVDFGAMTAGTANFSGDVSGAAWVKTSTNGRMILQYQNGNPLIYMSVGPTTAGGTDNKFVVYMRTNGGSVKVVSGATTITDGAWHHLAFTRDVSAQEIILYVDGVADGTFSYTDTGAIDTAGGAHRLSNPSSYPFNGNIDDFRIYSAKLTSSQVAALANGYRYDGNGSASPFALNANTLDVENWLTIQNTATLDASAAGCSGGSCDIEVAGNWTNNGTFTPRDGTVTFDGTNQTITGDTTFYNLVKSVSSPDTLTFGAGDTFNVNYAFTMKGISGNLLTATSSVDGTAWNLNANTHLSTVEYVDLNDSNNIHNKLEISCYPGCTDGGGNTNWLFAPKPAPRQNWRVDGTVRIQGNVRFGR